MLRLLQSLLRTLVSLFQTHRALALENLALRQQVALLKASTKRPQLAAADRIFWMALATWWPNWCSALLIVTPVTVIRWHREGFTCYWTWRSRRRGPGRPRIDPELRQLIRNMSRTNTLWGAPRIHGEILKLGLTVSQATVSKYMIRPRNPPSQTWRIFLDNHVKELVSIDFFTVPTATFPILYVFLVLRHERRRILRDYSAYYRNSRTHLSLDKDAPEPRPVEPPERGKIVRVPQVGGLHHRYMRLAA